MRAALAALLGALLCAAPANAGAGEHRPLVLSGGAASFPLRGHLRFLDDPTARLGIGDVRDHPGFQARPPGAVERNYTTGAVWYRFTVLRGAGSSAEWVLAIGEPFIDDIRVFVARSGGGFDESALGRRIPSALLPLAARRHVLRLGLPEAEPTDIYIRLASRDEIQFEAALWLPDALTFAEVRSATLLGMFFTTLVVIAAIYAMFGIGLRDPPMLAYAAYLASAVLFGSSHAGLLAILSPTLGGPVPNLVAGAGVLGNIAALVFMWDRVLYLRRTFPAFHRIYMAVCALALASIVTAPTAWFIHLVRPSFVATLAVTLVSLFLAAALLRRDRGNTLVRYYFLAFLPFLVFAGLHAAEVFLPSMLDILFVRRVGTAAMLMHIAILSLALAYRVSSMQRERLRAEELAASFDKTERALAGEQLARQRLRTFIDMATHEFKTPLAVIDSAAQVLELAVGSGRPEINARVDTIRRAVRRIVNLVETCLAGERDEALALKVERVEPAAVVAQAAQRNRDSGGAALVETADLPEACVLDPDLLGIALDALIDNARRYGRADRPVEIGATERDGRITFHVRDRGPGLPVGDEERVFSKYYRAASSGSVPGTGIGLHLVRTIAEMHGGRAYYEARQGGGAIFAIEVPAVG